MPLPALQVNAIAYQPVSFTGRDEEVTDEVVDAFATCVQCRGCEPACPSNVPYGHLMEQARESLVAAGEMTPKWQQLALKPLASPTPLPMECRVFSVENPVGRIARE